MTKHINSFNWNQNTPLPKITTSLSAAEYLRQNNTLVIPIINHELHTIASLDLSELHPNIREYLVRWLVEVNRRRLMSGQPMLITYEIIKQCPIWKSIRMPYKLLKLDKLIMAKKLADQQNNKNQ